MKNGSHRYDINRTRRRHVHRYTKYKICFSMVTVMCNKQHVSNIWSWIHGKAETELKKSVAFEKACILVGHNKQFFLSRESTSKI